MECAANAAWTPRPKDGGTYMPYCIRKLPFYDFVATSSTLNLFFYILAINCTEAPYNVRQNDLGMSNWTGIDGEDPRPYATQIRLHYLSPVIDQI